MIVGKLIIFRDAHAVLPRDARRPAGRPGVAYFACAARHAVAGAAVAIRDVVAASLLAGAVLVAAAPRAPEALALQLLYCVNYMPPVPALPQLVDSHD